MNNREEYVLIRLEAFDHRLLDGAVVKIMTAIHTVGAKIKGPIPLPTHIERYTVNRSPHVDKKSREQFEIRTHMRIFILVDTDSRTIDALKQLNLPSGVSVKIELKDKK